MHDFLSQIKSIKQDNRSGSAAVLKQVISAVKNYGAGLSKDALITELQELTKHHGQFPVLRHFYRDLKKNIKDGNNIMECVREYENQWQNVNREIAKNAIGHISLSGKTVLLLSNSSTITALFHKLRQKSIPVNVIQTISHPAREGKNQAENIAQFGFPVKVIEDNAIHRFIGEIDLCIVGADIVEEQQFLNKAGTYFAAIVCRQYKRPFYVLSDSRKVVTNSPPTKESAKPPEEVWPSPPENIRIGNFYFEYTPNALVNAFITEEKLLFFPSDSSI